MPNSRNHHYRDLVSKLFSRYWRTGDGSDPFHRYDYLLSEYKKAILNLVV